MGEASNNTQNVWAHNHTNKQREHHGDKEASWFPSVVFVKHQLNEILWAFSKGKSDENETDVSCEEKSENLWFNYDIVYIEK